MTISREEARRKADKYIADAEKQTPWSTNASTHYSNLAKTYALMALDKERPSGVS